MKRPGELNPREAAAHLEVHERTIRRWANAALDGEPSRLAAEAVRRDVTNHVWISRDEVQRILSASDF